MAEYRSVVPIMNTNNQDGFSVFSTTTNNVTTNGPNRAFDGDKDSSSYRSSISPRLPEYLWITFPEKHLVSRYTISLGYVNTQYINMATWEFQGLINDEWIPLHNGSNTASSNTLTFDIESTMVSGIRIKCNSRHGDNSWGINELNIYELVFRNKILVLSDGEYKTYQNSEWQTVTTSNPTEQDFLNHGMDDITMLNSQILSELNSSDGKIEVVYYTDDTNKQEANLEITANYSPLDELDDPELLLWTDDETTESKELKVTAVPRPKLVMPLRDLDIKGDLEKLDLQSLVLNISGENAIPMMSSNTTPSGRVEASSVYNSTWDAFRAFKVDQYGWCSLGNSRPEWISYQFTSNIIISKYAITATGFSDQWKYSPKSWTFEGWNGTSWVVLHEVSNSSPFTSGLRREFEFKNYTSYKKYRLNVSETQTVQYTIIGRLEMYEKIGDSKILIISSGDQGSTWKTFKQNTWKTVDISNLIKVKNNGMTADEINLLTREDWLALNPNQKIRLAYYLEQENSKETVEINSLSSIERITTSTPTLDSLTIIYDELDKKYSGLMFMDTSEQYYSTSIGEILKYLDMGTLVAGQTSLDVKVKLTNTYPFDVKNIRLWSEHDIEGLAVQFSKSTNPFIAENELFYDQQLNFDEIIEFSIRLVVDPSTQSGGNFDIRVSADPV